MNLSAMTFSSLLFSSISLLLLCSLPQPSISSQTPTLTLPPSEQEALYRVLEAINTETDWRFLFPDDLCDSAPHGVICDFVPETGNYHITELNLGFISDYSPNPPCSSNATFSPSISSFPFLRKLFFYQCFKNHRTRTIFSDYLYLSSLEELVLIDNPFLFGTLNEKIGNLNRLKRLIITGTRVSGSIPEEIGGLDRIEEMRLSKNRFKGTIPKTLAQLSQLRVLDLSFNGFEGNVPWIGGLSELLKLDLGFNKLNGTVPESLKFLKKLEFLDLSYNAFGNCGIPVFLGEMLGLKEVYLSGNRLGGEIPEIWDKLGGVLGLGLSNTGLVGKIPGSMGVFLKKLIFLGLDNNELEGDLPLELGFLESVQELNLEKNRLSGKVPFSGNFCDRVGGKLKLEGNDELCIENGLIGGDSHLGYLRVCSEPALAGVVLVPGFSGGSKGRVGFGFLGFFVSLVFLGFKWV